MFKAVVDNWCNIQVITDIWYKTMRKKIFLFCAACIFASAFSAHAVIVDLSKDNIEAAIRFGRNNKETIRETLNKMYCVGRDEILKEHAIIPTKWYKLSLLAALQAAQGKDISPEQKSSILEDTSLQIKVVVFGHKLDFAKGYKVLIIQDGKKIFSEKMHAYHSHNPLHVKNAFQGFPSYRATISAYFRYEHINPNGKASLVIIKNTKEKKFEIDFNRFK